MEASGWATHSFPAIRCTLRRPKAAKRECFASDCVRRNDFTFLCTLGDVEKPKRFAKSAPQRAPCCSEGAARAQGALPPPSRPFRSHSASRQRRASSPCAPLSSLPHVIFLAFKNSGVHKRFHPHNTEAGGRGVAARAVEAAARAP
jgi:hypothetical protein